MYAVKKSVLLKSATSRKVKPVKKKSALFASSGAVLALVLSACGGSGSGSSLSDVDYSMNGATAEPSVSFATPFAANGTEAYKIEDGDGATIEDGDSLLVDATVFSGTDGTSLGTTYTDAPMIIPVGEDLKKAAPELYDILIGSKVGMSFSYSTTSIPPPPQPLRQPPPFQQAPPPTLRSTPSLASCSRALKVPRTRKSHPPWKASPWPMTAPPP